MKMRVWGSNLTGKVSAISAKSVAHRLLICAALSGHQGTFIRCEEESEDILATIHCLEALGVKIERIETGYQLKPGPMVNRPEHLGHLVDLFCGESGSTLRFLLPVVAALGQGGRFHLQGRLSRRPLSPLYEELQAHGVRLSPLGQPTLTVEGQLKSGRYTLPGNISSQYFSGLFLALPLLAGDSQIYFQGKLESKQYLDLTIDALGQFGIVIEQREDAFIIAGGQSYQAPEQAVVEGDWSNGAFWLCAGAFSADGIECCRLNMQSLQGDKAVVDILEAFGAVVEKKDQAVFVKKVEKGTLRGLTIDAEQIPDLVPILSVVASVARGTTTIIKAGRLRLKESDRLKTVHQTLTALGARIREEAEGLTIEGVETLGGGKVSSHGDHRIAMMAAIAATVSTGEVIIDEAQVVSKSYPRFFDDFRKLGGQAEELD